MQQPIEIDVDEREQVVARVAGIDVAKASGMVCTRVPHESIPGRRVTKVWPVGSDTDALLELADHLVCDGIERAVLESTSDYWRPFYYILAARGLTVWLVNATQAKNVPGRPKTDKIDAVWLAKLAEKSMVSPSFVPAEPMRQVRDLARTRFDLVADRTRVKQRVEKLLEDAPLTELLRRSFVSWCRGVGCVATVRSRGWSSGHAAGSGVVGRAAGRVAGGDRRGLRAVSTRGRTRCGGRAGRREPPPKP